MVPDIARRRLLHGGAAFTLAALAGCLSVEPIDGDDDENGEVTTIRVAPGGEYRFDPDQVEIDVGETVEFEWESGGFNLEVLEQPSGATWEGEPEIQEAGHVHSHEFLVGGTYRFASTEHIIDPDDPGDPMEGIIEVQEEFDPGDPIS